MKDRFFQNIHVVNALPNEAAGDDIFAADPATDVVNLAKYDRVTWLIQKGAGNTGTALITVESCSNATPSATTQIAFDYWSCTSGDTWSDKSTAVATGFTTTAGANQVYAVEINASELSSTHQYVRLVATEVDDSPVTGSIVCILSNPRYMHEVKQSAIV